MQLSEIYNNISRDEHPESYQYHFTNITHSETLQTRLILAVSQDQTFYHIGVFDDKKLISYVGLHKIDRYWQVDMQCTDRNYQGQGYIRKCIEYAITNLKCIISDVAHTPEAQAVWTALIKNPNLYHYYLYDQSSHIKTPLTCQNGKIIPDPWDQTENHVIMASNRTLTESAITRIEKRAMLDRNRNRRDPWLGSGFKEFNP